jgi:hypothetical protein
MKAVEILVAVRKAGATLRVEDDSLVASHASRIAPAIKTAIRANKPQIIAALADPICAVCRAGSDLWQHGDALVHQECARFLQKPDSDPDLVWQQVSAEPDGRGCRVTIVEVPAKGLRYRRTFTALQLKPPALVERRRWRQCVQDGSKFLARWGEQAEAFGWSSADLFGLHQVPERPHPSYGRLSRYGQTGLVWLLQGREVIALTETTASIRNPGTGTQAMSWGAVTNIGRLPVRQ